MYLRSHSKKKKILEHDECKWSTQSYTLQEIIQKFPMPMVIKTPEIEANTNNNNINNNNNNKNNNNNNNNYYYNNNNSGASEQFSSHSGIPGLESETCILLYKFIQKQKLIGRHLCLEKPGKNQNVILPEDYPGWFVHLHCTDGVVYFYDTLEELAEARVTTFVTRSRLTGWHLIKSAAGNIQYKQCRYSPGSVFQNEKMYVGKLRVDKGFHFFKWRKSKLEDVKYLKCYDIRNREVLFPVSREGMFIGVLPFYTENGKTKFVVSTEQLFQVSTVVSPVMLVYGHKPQIQNFSGIFMLDRKILDHSVLGVMCLETHQHMFLEIGMDSMARFNVALNGAAIMSKKGPLAGALKLSKQRAKEYAQNIRMPLFMTGDSQNEEDATGRSTIKQTNDSSRKTASLPAIAEALEEEEEEEEDEDENVKNDEDYDDREEAPHHLEGLRSVSVRDLSTSAMEHYNLSHHASCSDINRGIENNVFETPGTKPVVDSMAPHMTTRMHAQHRRIGGSESDNACSILNESNRGIDSPIDQIHGHESSDTLSSSESGSLSGSDNSESPSERLFSRDKISDNSISNSTAMQQARLLIGMHGAGSKASTTRRCSEESACEQQNTCGENGTVTYMDSLYQNNTYSPTTNFAADLEYQMRAQIELAMPLNIDELIDHYSKQPTENDDKNYKKSVNKPNEKIIETLNVEKTVKASVSHTQDTEPAVALTPYTDHTVEISSYESDNTGIMFTSRMKLVKGLANSGIVVIEKDGSSVNQLGGQFCTPGTNTGKNSTVDTVNAITLSKVSDPWLTRKHIDRKNHPDRLSIDIKSKMALFETKTATQADENGEVNVKSIGTTETKMLPNACAGKQKYSVMNKIASTSAPNVNMTALKQNHRDHHSNSTHINQGQTVSNAFSRASRGRVLQKEIQSVASNREYGYEHMLTQPVSMASVVTNDDSYRVNSCIANPILNLNNETTNNTQIIPPTSIAVDKARASANSHVSAISRNMTEKHKHLSTSAANIDASSHMLKTKAGPFSQMFDNSVNGSSKSKNQTYKLHGDNAVPKQMSSRHMSDNSSVRINTADEKPAPQAYHNHMERVKDPQQASSVSITRRARDTSAEQNRPLSVSVSSSVRGNNACRMNIPHGSASLRRSGLQPVSPDSSCAPSTVSTGTVDQSRTKEHRCSQSASDAYSVHRDYIGRYEAPSVSNVSKVWENISGQKKTPPSVPSGRMIKTAPADTDDVSSPIRIISENIDYYDALLNEKIGVVETNV